MTKEQIIEYLKRNIKVTKAFLDYMLLIGKTDNIETIKAEAELDLLNQILKMILK